MMISEAREQRSDNGVCWFEWGEPVAGSPTLLLLHATSFHARLWDQVVAHLPPGTHVVAPDFPGHGRSVRPDSLSDWVVNGDMLLPLIDSLAGRRIVGSGHSLGGYVLSRLAALRPEAFSALFLVDPTIMSPDFYKSKSSLPFVRPEEHPISRRRNRWSGPEEMYAALSGRLPFSKWPEQVVRDYCRYGLVPAADGEEYELGCPPLLEASTYMGALNHDPYQWLGDIRAPVSLVYAPQGEWGGPMDFSQSPTWRGVVDKLPVTMAEEWQDNSHFIPMESPERVAGVLTGLLEQVPA